MFFKVALAVSSLFFFVNAGAVGGTNQCNTGNAQCCNEVYQAKSAKGLNLTKNLIGVSVGDITGLIGAQCSPLSIVNLGVTGNCNSNAVCCTDNKQTGLVNVGCVPVQL